MEEKDLITLSDYSSKYGVSISTLRRRIKTQRVEFIYKDSKYFLLDKPLGYHRKNMGRFLDTEDFGIISNGGESDSSHTSPVKMDNHKEHQPSDTSQEVLGSQPTEASNNQADPLKDTQHWQKGDLNTLSDLMNHLGSTQSEDGQNKPPHEQLDHLDSSQSKANQNKIPPHEQRKDPNKDILFIAHQLEKSIKPHVKDVLATTNRLLDEIKKTYSLILQEKEEEIIFLKDEMTNLKTLVCVLEDENKKLCEQMTENSRNWPKVPTV